MKIEEILEKYKEDFSKLATYLCQDLKERDIEKNRKEYEGEHVILDRPLKTAGTGKTLKKVDQAKLVIRFQEKIVEMAISFLFGEPVKLSLNNQEEKYKVAFDLIQDVWKKNKLDYFNRKLTRRLMIETKAAELWYTLIDENNIKHVKVALLCDKNGDEIYPHFDENGDMDAFVRRYNLKELDEKTYEHIDIYTAAKTILGVKKDTWQLTKKENMAGKIPVIYYDRDEPEWESVQTEIDKIEMLLSKFSDTNDYFGAPTLKIFGKIINPPEKGEVGRTLRFKGEQGAEGKTVYGDAKYLTWEHAPESIKIEYDILKDIIYSMTSTPDLSFNNVKGLTQTSGETLKFLFMDAILKAKSSEELFGEALTRRLNLLKAMLGVVSVKDKQNLDELDIAIEFGDVLPKSITELVKSLSIARGGDSIMSQEEAVRKNPLVSNAEEDLDRLNKEKEKSEVANLGESFNV